MTARVFAFTNNKGGTGKSTLCSNVAHCAALAGHRVLIIDLTSQITCTTLFLEQGDTLDETETVLALLKKKPDRSVIEVCHRSHKNLDIIPASVSMAQAVVELSAIPIGAEKVLDRHIQQISDRYDFIFIDSPGELNQITSNALVCAHKILVPTRVNRTDFQCTETMIQFIEEVAPIIGHKEVKVIINMLDDRYKTIWAGSHLGRLYLQAQETFGALLSPITIPESNDIRTAFDRGLTVMEHRPKEIAAKRIQELFKQEVVGSGKRK
ncbi:MAG: ParA family protein [Pseudanabaenaceae cyanobacterium SKYGB_i_bin29]|nr:ParA family protein [Pseudanabaenaceae cyanobacterium SKYG29]MDW8422652.1 ParA family protein [Pseudanabaenaceae cyanobacterium SKYGB_i_bin29]